MRDVASRGEPGAQVEAQVAQVRAWLVAQVAELMVQEVAQMIAAAAVALETIVEGGGGLTKSFINTQKNKI